MLTCDSDDGAGQSQRFCLDKLTFLDTKVGKELSILAQVSCRRGIWSEFSLIGLDDEVRVKETPVRQKQVDEVIDRVLEKLPIDYP